MKSLMSGIAIAACAVGLTGGSWALTAGTALAGAGPTAQQQALSFIATTFEDNQPQVWSPTKQLDYERFAQRIEAQADHTVPGWKLLMLARELAAWFHDQHADIIAPPPTLGIPVEFYWASDGLVAIPVPRSPKGMRLGDEVVRIGNRTVASITTMLPEITSGNTYLQKYFAGKALAYANFLRMLGVVSPGGYVNLEMRRPGGEIYAVRLKLIPTKLAVTPASQIAADKFERRFLLPAGVWSSGKPFFSWRVNVKHDYGFFWLTQCTPSRALRNGIRQFFTEVETSGIRNVVIDEQGNPGGIATVVNTFLAYLPTPGPRGVYTIGSHGGGYYTILHPRSPDVYRGKVYVLMNWSTESSAVLLADVLQTNDLATAVGQPTGGPPQPTLNPQTWTVPNTHLTVVAADLTLDANGLEQANSPALYPRIKLPITVQDIQSGVNPVTAWLDSLSKSPRQSE